MGTHTFERLTRVHIKCFKWRTGLRQMWQSSALPLSPSTPFFPQALPCAALGYFTTKSNRNHGASFGSFGGTRHKSRLITQPATLLQLFRVPLEPITQGSRQHPKPQLPLTPDYLPCTEIHNVCSFIVRGFFFFLFCEGLGRRSFKGCGASVANRFDCFVGIVITSITYYCCSDDVLYSMHTWNFHINFGNINGAHTHTLSHTHKHLHIGRL